MGTLREMDGSGRYTMCARTVVGRSSRCDLTLGQKRVSAEHAALFHVDGAWLVRDLGSRNGTYVDGRRLGPGERVTLREGSEVVFADSKWRLEVDCPPVPRALRAGTGRRVFAEAGMLAIPEADGPRVQVYPGPGGRWLLEEEGSPRIVTDQDIVELDDELWILELPSAGGDQELADTWATAMRVCAFEALDLMLFRVDKSGGFVDLELQFGERVLRPAHRTAHELLLALARARLDDRTRGEREEGWRTVNEVADIFGWDPNRLNVEVYRARQQLASEGVAGSGALVERRSPARQIRIGTANLRIDKA